MIAAPVSNRIAHLFELEELLVADLLCGAGGFSEGARRAITGLGRRVRMVAVNHWDRAIETHRKNHPDCEHFLVDVYKTDPLEAVPGGRLDILMASPTCFPAGTLVLTEHGLMAIENVLVGDRVLTHKGRWRKVAATASRSADTVILSGQGHYGLETTAEHPFYARERRALHRRTPAGGFRYLDPEWRRADDMAGCMWATPTSVEALHEPPPVGGRGMAFTPEFWWMVGRWLADGYVNDRSGAGAHGSEVLIACGNHEADEFEKRLAFAHPSGPRARGSELRWNRRRVRTGTRFDTGHDGLVLWLVANFGKLAGGKFLPAWALSLPESDRRALLDGYLSGDGCFSETGPSPFRVATSVSKRLAVGIRLLATSLGHRPRLNFVKARPATIEGRVVETRDQYAVAWADHPQRVWGPPSDAHLWQKVREVAPGRSGVRVFNLQVEEDESYTADGIVVHNCTFNSRARGGKPISREQRYGRMTPTQVIRWIAELDVKVLIVENVPEYKDWGPVHLVTVEEGSACAFSGCSTTRAGLPCKRRKGYYFRPWLRKIEALGYQVEHRILNAADFGDATTRKRFFLVARKDGIPVRWPRASHSKTGGRDLFGTVLEKWRGAREVIDPTIPSQSIYTRKTPLAIPTRARVRGGLVKFNWDHEYVETLDAYNEGRPLPIYFKPTRGPATAPAPDAMVVTLRAHASAKSPDEPIPATCAGGTHIAIAQPAPAPFLVPQNGEQNPTQTLEGPVSTIVAVPRIGLAEAKPQSIMFAQGSNGAPKPTEEPVPTLLTAGRTTLVDGQAFIARTDNPRSNADCVRPPEDPLATITTANGLGLVQGQAQPFVLSQGAGGAPRSTEEPLPTAPTRGAHELVRGFLASYYGNGQASSLELPVPTQPTKDRFALVLPHRDAAPPDGFILASFGERPGQAPRVHDLGAPIPAITATGHTNLASDGAQALGGEVLVDGVWGVWVFYDIHLRMLQPPELSRAHSFEDGEFAYEFCGNKTEVCRQIGNSVPVRTSRALVLAQIVPLEAAEAA